MIRARGFALYGPLAASTRYRLEQFIPGLREHGIELNVVHLLDDDYLSRRFGGRRASMLGLARAGTQRLADLLTLRSHDVALIHCELLPAAPGYLEQALVRRPYLYDFDDAFYLRYRFGRLSALRFLLESKFDQIMAGAAAITAGNEELQRYAAQFNPGADYLPTVVDTNHHLPLTSRKSSVLTVGWIGSPSTAQYLDQVVQPLAQLGKEAHVRLVVIGGQPPRVPGVEVQALPWSADNEIDLINTFDIGIMPIPDDAWSRGKCAFKLIQYMACAVPVVGSAVGANRTVVTSDCGYLASTPDEWLNSLRELRDSPLKRRQMGEAGRQRVVDHFSLQYALPRMAAAISKAARK